LIWGIAWTLEVVAEGVKQRAAMDALRQMGCDSGARAFFISPADAL